MSHLADATTLVLQDYDKGVLEEPEALIEAARAAGVPVVVDPKHKPFGVYAGADLLKPNVHEFRSAAGAWRDDDDLVSRAVAVCGRERLGALVITRGGQGMTVVQSDGVHQHIPARPVDVYDVTGAGDTAAAALAVTRSLGWDAVSCAQVANVASGIAVGKSGTVAVTGPELAMALASSQRGDRGILNRQQLVDAVARARAAGERVVFTNGCFDILHAGHVAYLEEARALGDRLVVAVNDDDSVRRLKGPGRPVNPLERRLRVLSGLSAVDWLVGFPEDTPESLLEALRPDVLVKGGDYGPEGVVGADIVTGFGGEVRVLSLVEDCSTTAIVARIQGDPSGERGPRA
jgi:D-beta-D-heptose 7-phosphate kinase/D-beta-D-heptose 1-phosphate adenosyltransferase